MTRQLECGRRRPGDVSPSCVASAPRLGLLDGEGAFAYFDTAAALGVCQELIERPGGGASPTMCFP